MPDRPNEGTEHPHDTRDPATMTPSQLDSLEQYLEDWEGSPDSIEIDSTPNCALTLGVIRKLIKIAAHTPV